MGLIIVMSSLTVLGSLFIYLILQEWRWLSQFNEWELSELVIDMYVPNMIIENISIVIPFDFYVPYLMVLSVGAILWLGRLDILAMRSAKRHSL